jgi:MFS transporter, DHA1 family, tetracycline resistance protein
MLVRLFGERRVVLAGLAFLVLGFVGLAIAPTGLWFAASCAIICLGNVASPPLQTLLTHKVGPDEQGRMQGALSSLTALTGMVGPIAFTQIFAWSIAAGAAPSKAGIALAIGALLAALAWLLALKVAKSPEAAEAETPQSSPATPPALEPTILPRQDAT